MMNTTLLADLDGCHEAVEGERVGPADPGSYPACKAVADRAAASILLVLTSPIILALIVLVKLTSRGPAIYQQVRLGRGGMSFRILKLRTMRHDCERLTGPQWAAKRGDPRVTPLGAFLRKSHLDELPQLWNVIRGEMSLVGPRPERPEFVAKLEKQIPEYRDRMVVRPGITGLAQVRLPADEDIEDVRRKVRYDLLYIEALSPLMDLKILIGTAMKIAGFPFDRTAQLLNLPRIGPAERDGPLGARGEVVTCIRADFS